jgi:hypothetical protein
VSGVLLEPVRRLLTTAGQSAVRPVVREELAAAMVRLDEPLRVAVVGRVKAGKSTLVNALVGEEVAPTDTAECTQVVTWYRSGSPRAVVHPRTGPAEQRRFDRRTGAVRVDLGRPVDDVERVEVWWPSSPLRACTLIDTPGLASLSTASERTVRFLDSDEERPTEADAVIYLLRHVHASDLRFLEAFSGDELVQGTPLNTVGVLARADEVGVCRLDAMEVADRVAQRYAGDERLRRLCPVVVPVAGLLAVAGATWREDEFRVLARIATAPKDDLLDLLLSAESWASADTRIPVTAMERRHLLDRLGLFGVRLAVQLVRSREVTDASSVGRVLTDRSGLTRLRQVVAHQFLARAQALKARSALATVEAVLDEGGFRDGPAVAAEVEAVRVTAHEFTELRLLHLLRSGRVKGKPDRLAELERLLGGAGHAPAARLSLPPGATAGELRAAGYSALTRCRALAEHSLASQELRRAAAGAARSCEGLLFDLETTEPAGLPG